MVKKGEQLVSINCILPEKMPASQCETNHQSIVYEYSWQSTALKMTDFCSEAEQLG
jgi:hypothetical protein